MADPEIDCGNCADCPRVKNLIQDAKLAESEASVAVRVAMSQSLTVVVEAFFKEVVNMTNSAVLHDPHTHQLIDNPAELATAIRKYTALGISALEDDAAEDRRLVTELVENCDGPLTMQTTEADRTYAVTVCQSPELPDGSKAEFATIERTTEPF